MSARIFENGDFPLALSSGTKNGGVSTPSAKWRFLKKSASRYVWTDENERFWGKIMLVSSTRRCVLVKSTFSPCRDWGTQHSFTSSGIFVPRSNPLPSNAP